MDIAFYSHYSKSSLFMKLIFVHFIHMMYIILYESLLIVSFFIKKIIIDVLFYLTSAFARASR